MTFVTGSTALIIERDVLREKCDRLTRELEEAKAEIERLKAKSRHPRMCPWCGNIPHIRPDWTDGQRFRIDCVNDDCPVKPGCKGDNEEDAVAIWNGEA